jgi:hypothetical protein
VYFYLVSLFIWGSAAGNAGSWISVSTAQIVTRPGMRASESRLLGGMELHRPWLNSGAGNPNLNGLFGGTIKNKYGRPYHAKNGFHYFSLQ